MDIKLKHRLVGACVILALAVFFLPMILDSEKYRQDIESEIPTDSVLKRDSNVSAKSAVGGESGSLTINLDEDEPIKAIKENEPKPQPQPKSKPVVTPAVKDTASTSKAKKAVEAKESVTEASDDSLKSQASSKKTSQSEVVSKPVTENETSTKVVSTPKKEIKKPAQAKDSTTSNNKKAKKATNFEEVAWVIQIGSFSNKDNATALVSELRNKGYRAYQRDAGKFSRVYVGPYPDESAAKNRTKSLEDIVGAPVKVLQFDPQGH